MKDSRCFAAEGVGSFVERFLFYRFNKFDLRQCWSTGRVTECLLLAARRFITQKWWDVFACSPGPHPPSQGNRSWNVNKSHNHGHKTYTVAPASSASQHWLCLKPVDKIPELRFGTERFALNHPNGETQNSANIGVKWAHGWKYFGLVGSTRKHYSRQI